MTTIQQLAAEASAQFVQGVRKDNAGDLIWHRKPGAENWIQDMCHEAHDRVLPNDWVYRFIVESLDTIAEMTDPSDYDERSEAIDGMVSVYTHELMAWASDGHSGHVDEAEQEWGLESGTPLDRRLALGQYHHINEVFSDVLSALEAQCDELETQCA